MKSIKILTIVVLALWLFAGPVQPAGAEPMGTAFTYQGRLIDANKTADGLYDLQFKLYDANVAGTQKGSAIDIGEVDVIDGYFTVLLDLGSGVFDGNDRWLEIGVRPGNLNDPNVYTLLSPRQEITPTPYALYAKTAGSGGGDNLGNHTATQNVRLNSYWLSGDGDSEGVYVANNGNVGIGTTGPSTRLEVTGQVKITGGSPAAGKVLTSDSSGLATWQTPVTGITGSGTTNYLPKFTGGSTVGNSVVYESGGNVGIGTTSPSAKLEVAGQVKITGGSPAAGKVLTSDSSGLASWQTLVTGDNLGNHTATQNIRLNSFWLSGDGGSEGVYVANAGNVGIGTSSPDEKLTVGGTVKATTSADTGRGVYGSATNSGNYINYGGYFESAGREGMGVAGYATGILGYGVFGLAGTGMQNYGGYFQAGGATGSGVFGEATNSGDYVNYGGFFQARGASGYGVYGNAYNPGNYTNYGGYFLAEGTSGQGVHGEAAGSSGIGVYGHSTSGKGVCGISESGYAGYFFGNVNITGNLYKGGGSFKIDHPLDPENKYLLHSFVESPDMMNIYNGNIILDSNGQAVVLLPEWFEALNQDFRYQLTCIGSFAQVYIAEKISENHFKIAGGKPGMEVSWQVTGIRQDPYAVANRIQVEEDKPVYARGYYLYPEVYGQPREKNIENAPKPSLPKEQQMARK